MCTGQSGEFPKPNPFGGMELRGPGTIDPLLGLSTLGLPQSLVVEFDPFYSISLHRNRNAFTHESFHGLIGGYPLVRRKLCDPPRAAPTGKELGLR
jgi:hypothetical protein